MAIKRGLRVGKRDRSRSFEHTRRCQTSREEDERYVRSYVDQAERYRTAAGFQQADPS